MDTDGGAMTVTDQAVAVAKKPAKPAAAARKPHTLDQVVDAITQNPDRKGVSVAAIKNHLAKQDSSVTAKVIKNRLRKALDKGFSLNLIVRPKGSENTGVSLSGRFLVNKEKLKTIRKDKTSEAKPTKPSPTDDDMPPKKVANKTVKKTTTTNKENVAKAANKVVKAKPKVVKKSTSKPTSLSTKTTKAKEVKVAKKTAATTTAKSKVVKAKVSKPKSATVTKTATAKKKTAKVLTTKNKMPGTPKITQPKKPRNM